MSIQTQEKPVGQILVELAPEKEKFREFLKTLKPLQLVEAEKFLWEYLVELARARKVPLGRQDITGRMLPTRSYQRNVGCNEREDYCRANICVFTNPVCAGNKIKGYIDVLRTLILEIANA